jgi:multiple sugar transport system substrate-binding protein
MPVDTGSMVMYYNKDLFDAAAVPYPKDTWTQQDFLDTLQKVQDGLKKAGKDGVFAYQPNYNDPYVRDFRWWRSNGGSEFDALEDPKKATWDQPALADAWQRELFDLSKKGVAITQAALVSGGGSNAYYTFGIQNGLAAMKMEGPWFLPQMWGDKAATKGGLKFDVVQMPKGSSSSSSFWQVEPITVWKTSKSPDACWEYLKYAVGTEAQQFVAQGGRMTNTPKSIAELWAPLAQKAYNFQNATAFAAADGASMVSTGGISTDQMALQGGLNDARDAVINGTKTAKEALAGVNPQMQALIDQWWKDHPNS